MYLQYLILCVLLTGTTANIQDLQDESNKTYMVFLDDWSGCKDPEINRHDLEMSAYKRGFRQHTYSFTPKLGIKLRAVQCRDSNGTFVPPRYCGQRIESIVSKQLCVLSIDCELTRWSNWRFDHNTGGQMRDRKVLKLPQGAGKLCGAVVEKKSLNATKSDPDWVAEAWGPCIVASDKPTAVEETVWSEWGAGVTSGQCGGGEQRRIVRCLNKAGRQLPETACDIVSRPNRRQPCEVSCPRLCRMGPWSNWSACMPLTGCPMYPVQQLTTAGYSVRTRRLVEVDSHEDQSICGPFEEIRTCASPRCATWKTYNWRPCSLEHPEKHCGYGTTTRQIECVDDNGVAAPEEWCAGQLVPTTKKCRVVCPGECALSPWEEWTECEATCAATHLPPPRRTRTRYIVAHGTPDREQCPKPQDLVQSEICNNHGCNSFSWMWLPWSKCHRPSNIDDFHLDPVNLTLSDGRKCSDVGLEKREVWCMQNNEKIVQDSFCSPLPKPSTYRACKFQCPLSCDISAWTQWSPCPEGGAEVTSQIRVRRVTGGQECGEPIERRVCPIITKVHYRQIDWHVSQWRAGKWHPCRSLPGQDTGLQERTVWCESAKTGDRVNAAKCVGKMAPVAVRTCPKFNTSPSAEKCRTICNDPYTSLDDMREGCECVGYSLQVLPASECILHKSMKYGSGRKLRAVVCRGPDDEFLPVPVCRRNIDLKSLENLKDYDWDPEFPEVVSTDCNVDPPIDCSMGRWSEWGQCQMDSFRYRNRTILWEMQNGGRPCASTYEKMVCEVEVAKWEVSTWSICIPTQSPCGHAFMNRTVRCMSKSGELDESHCMDKKPVNEVRCRAPCPSDCVLSRWSDWSKCRLVNDRPWKDRSRHIIRRPLPGGVGCVEATQAQPCSVMDIEQHIYNWSLTDWDTCQPLGGSPCGEGKKHRAIRCQNELGELLDDSFCEGIPFNDTWFEDWCYMSCSSDCETTEWSEWDLSNCVCGLQDSYATRNRSIMNNPVGNGRQCGDLTQRIPCPMQPCLGYIQQQANGKCLLLLSEKYVEEAEKVCGRGSVATCGDYGNGNYAWQCEKVASNQLFIPDDEAMIKNCVIGCDCPSASCQTDNMCQEGSGSNCTKIVVDALTPKGNREFLSLDDAYVGQEDPLPEYAEDYWPLVTNAEENPTTDTNIFAIIEKNKMNLEQQAIKIDENKGLLILVSVIMPLFLLLVSGYYIICKRILVQQRAAKV